MENSYQQGVLEANELHKAHKELRSKLQSQSKHGSLVRSQLGIIKRNTLQYFLSCYYVTFPPCFIFFSDSVTETLKCQIFTFCVFLFQKPPQYVKIKTNKPVGSVKMLEVDTSNISPCECDPNSDHPCSPDSECLNRSVHDRILDFPKNVNGQKL